MNLPNALTIGRIVVTPLIMILPLMNSAAARLAAFVIFLVAAITDYYDGVIARTRGLITDLGKILDPLADKLLLIGTFVPMFYLQAPATDPLMRLIGAQRDELSYYPFVIQMLGAEIRVPFYWWVALIVLGRELAMTIMRQIAARRGTYIAAIGSAKLKTVFQLIWVGAAYFWFFVGTVDVIDVRASNGWGFLENLAGIVGTVTMITSVALTLYTLGVYIVRFGPALARSSAAAKK
jgi:phosphatidylglycerophosphate synthase